MTVRLDLTSAWDDMTTIGALLQRFGGDIKTGPFGTTLKASEYSAQGVPLISVGEVDYGFLRLRPSTPRVPDAVVARLPEYLLEEGDIVFGRKGAVDRSARVTRIQRGWFLGSDGIRLRLPAGVDSHFLGYQLRSPALRAWIIQHATGTIMPSLNQGVIERIPIVLPPVATQKGIAKILGALDDKIELNRRTNETLEAMARALFQSWFVDFDPVRAKMEGRKPEGMDAETAKLFPQALDEGRPIGWSLSALGSVTSKIGSGATPRGGDKAYVEEGVALIRSQNVYDSEFVWAGLARITDQDAKQLAGVAVQSGDTLLNITGASILRTCVVEDSVLPARVNQHVAIIRPRPGIPTRYVHLHMLQSETKAFLLGHDAGGSRQAVTKAHIESVPVLLPSAPILSCFARAVDPLFARVAAADRESRALASLRDVLLPKLLSGELRVPEAELAVSAAL